jgi:hypothetical protein
MLVISLVTPRVGSVTISEITVTPAGIEVAPSKLHSEVRAFETGYI